MAQMLQCPEDVLAAIALRQSPAMRQAGVEPAHLYGTASSRRHVYHSITSAYDLS